MAIERPVFTLPEWHRGETAKQIQARMMERLPTDIDNIEGGFPYDFTMPTALEEDELMNFVLVETLKIMFPIQSTTEEEKAAAKDAVIENLQQIIFGLVTDVEKELGGGTGKLKSSKVAGWIYDKIPDELKPLFTAQEIQDMIDTVLQDAQEYWEKNGKAREYIDSGTANLLTAEVGVVAPPVTVEEIVQAVGDRIGNSIAKAAEVATVGPQDGQNAAPDIPPPMGSRPPQRPRRTPQAAKFRRRESGA